MSLNKYLKPKINKKIINFFLENPSCIDTSRGIATWINENTAKTEKALKDLAKANILIPHGTGSTSAYGYTTNSRIVSSVNASLKKFETKKKKKDISNP